MEYISYNSCLTEQSAQIESLILSRDQRKAYGFPVQIKSQVYVQPCQYSSRELFYTEYDTTRVCSRCQTVFEVEQDGYQRIWGDSPVCQVANHGMYNFHIHTQQSVEVLKTFQRAPKEDQWNHFMSRKLFALDVESVYTSHGQAVGRVTVVDQYGNVALDCFVKPKEMVYDYVTQYSGLTPEHLEYATETVESVRDKIFQFINRRSILVGHALNGDLKNLGIVHSEVIDTSVIFSNNGRRPSLRDLASRYLNWSIQNSANGHCSYEDSIASLNLVYFASENPHLLSPDFQKCSLSY
ncbi:hypothetical protein B9Z55_002777 [Caenorhabditis nigoni]|uniref:Exonuclease domain-containing protein n=1 Tax=Caenorhabditis nigoni TaxID=1611254 RepID=A0A2G5VMD8_9PELO|nr:hypothetical protein B9Z55_002777 [Caenorhabditis nigoni]